MRATFFILFAVMITACQPAAAPHPVIVSHVSAFNAGDVAAMGRLEHPDIEWINVENSSMSIEVSGRAELAAMMTQYMLENPTVIGSLRDWSINGDFISVTETASWTTQSGEKQSQSALSVYQMEGDLIRRVWYYPAVRH